MVHDRQKNMLFMYYSIIIDNQILPVYYYF